LRQVDVIWSGGEVEWLIDGLDGECLRAVTCNAENNMAAVSTDGSTVCVGNKVAPPSQNALCGHP
jgi:hypothetical protein